MLWSRAWRGLVFGGVVLGGIAAFAQLGLNPAIVPVAGAFVLLYAVAPGVTSAMADFYRRWHAFPAQLELAVVLTNENRDLSERLARAVVGQSTAFERGQREGWRAHKGIMIGRRAAAPTLVLASADSARGGALVLVGRGRGALVGAWYTLEIEETRDAKGILEIIEVGDDDRCVLTCVRPLDRTYWDDLSNRPRHETSAPGGAVLVPVTEAVFARASNSEAEV